LHILSAFLTDDQIVLGEITCDEKRLNYRALKKSISEKGMDFFIKKWYNYSKKQGWEANRNAER